MRGKPVQLKPRSSAGWTMAVFGVLAIGMGIVGLVAPDALVEAMGFSGASDGGRTEGDHTLVFVTASSMAAVNMGVYYLLAAASDWTPFFRWTVPFRLLTLTVFTLAVLSDRAPAGFIGVGLWEGMGAMATAIALRADKRRTTGESRTSQS
ncbi:hypothetical protein DSC45_26015 [Streptomyces sp. YIM 130001]|uniref:hypothetical protein n=1 Tax=Streptomyces sp. YIM 130001 TaxID=2259644 RepID=UPI000EC0538F|nr:hypothetical protein [Streptomyces sp. YIM 130001]RII12322.1 hypothetical protein DSC45_26015 [Streptomyces sp. YIM 130001]